MKLLIYMPALDEEVNIINTINHLPKTFEGIDYVDILVVDDGSRDSTAIYAQKSGAEVIRHGYNRGVGAAFQTAVKFALEKNYDILVSIDADGQFDPDQIPILIEPILKQEAEMVFGNRFENGKPEYMSVLKYWGNQQIAKIIRFVSGMNFHDVSCGFRAYSREALFHMNLFGNFTYTHETILSLVFKSLAIKEIPVFVRYDAKRKSRVANSIINYAFQTSKIIFRALLDYRPMRFFGVLAGMLILIGGLFVMFLMGHYFFSGAFTPYKSFGFIGLGFVLLGMLVFLVAFVADMINRIRMNQDRMLYEIRKSRYEK